MEEILSERSGHTVRIAVPIRGEKAVLTANTVRNAREALAMRVVETAAQGKLLAGLGEVVGLEQAPGRVEVYDNSHMQGKNSVGALIVVGPEGFVRNSYRKFNFRDPQTRSGDDFSMMREVLGRRFERLSREDPDRETEEWPDLLVIDGGKGQVSSVTAVLEDLGVRDMPVVGVSKGRQRNAGLEQLHLADGTVRALQPQDPVLYFIQRIRDEAHRFAIGAHRSKQRKSTSATPIDDIPGVGAARKSALLARFGSATAIGRAGLEDLQAVKGVSRRLAQTIYEHFH